MIDTTDWGDRTEQSVLDAAIARAPARGWNARLVREACEACGLSRGDDELLLPNGPRDLAALLSRRHDARALEALGEPGAMKIRDKIFAAVSARMEAGTADLEATKNCCCPTARAISPPCCRAAMMTAPWRPWARSTPSR